MGIIWLLVILAIVMVFYENPEFLLIIIIIYIIYRQFGSRLEKDRIHQQKIEETVREIEAVEHHLVDCRMKDKEDYSVWCNRKLEESLDVFLPYKSDYEREKRWNKEWMKERKKELKQLKKELKKLQNSG